MINDIYFDSYKEALKKRVKQSRYVHSIGVMQVSIDLAKKYGLDEKRVGLAALLHDYGKALSDEQLNEYLILNGLQIDEYIRKDMQLAHGIIGADMVTKDFCISDQEILDSIRYHTYGRSGMSMMEKIIYIADYIEPSRSYEGVEQLRKTVYEDLDRGIILSIENTVKYLEGRGFSIHPNSILLRNELLSNLMG